ncbi:MAG: hypothetical protein P4N60_01395 [Verrucomicrobiae bacterium]|nr:hypothetical protein [Verrucomicrobiae bacterium]
MKSFSALAISFLIAGSLAAAAQSLPKLAIAGVTASPEVAKKFNVTAPGTDEKTAAEPVDLTGVWNGATHSNGKVFPFVLTVTKAADGSQYAELKNIKRGNDFHSTSVACKGNHVTITFGEGGKSEFLDGRLDPGNVRMQMSWNGGGGHARLVLEKSQMMSNGKQTGGTVAPVVSLEMITHALEVQLADRFAAEHSFSILEEDDLQAAIPLKENQTYNLKNLDMARQFKQAGINYLLVTTLEDVKNETVDKAQGKVAYETANGNAQSVQLDSKKVKAKTAAHSAIDTQGKFDAHRVIQQSVYLLVRCRLFNAATGELLDSASHTFTTNRTYIALAAGTKDVSASDLFETAANSLADRIATREREAVFPIKVLAKDGPEITINCGVDAGLKPGQIFNVCTTGKELKDPTTGESLGFDEKVVGRVTISDLQPKFSKAKIWEDNGIAEGNFLRRDKAD